MDLVDVFKGQMIDLTCPGCGCYQKVQAELVLRAGSKTTCSGCGKVIAFTHDAKTRSELHSAERALQDLQRTLRRFGR